MPQDRAIDGPAVYPTTAPATAPIGPSTTAPDTAPNAASPARSPALSSADISASARATPAIVRLIQSSPLLAQTIARILAGQFRATPLVECDPPRAK